MKKSWVVLFFMSGCSLNQLNGGYDTHLSQKTLLLPAEGVVVASTVNRTGLSLPLSFLVVKDGACNGFSSFGDEVGNADVYKRPQGFVVNNFKKFPAGTYHIYGWMLYSGSLASGGWQYSKDEYDLEFEVKAGEITYLGEINATPAGVKLNNQMDRDLLVFEGEFPMLSAMNKRKEIPDVKPLVLKNCK